MKFLGYTMTMRSMRANTAVITALSILLGACASTKPIEHVADDMVKQAESSAETMETGTVYPDSVAGTIEDLYGSDVSIETSEAYRRAVEENPALQYNIIYFEFDSSEVSEAARELLARHADYLIENPDILVILEGHTDKRGSEGYNLALGERRAMTVEKVLLGFGLPESQLSTVSFGEEKPAIFGDSEQAFNKNRRVELVYQ